MEPEGDLVHQLYLVYDQFVREVCFHCPSKNRDNPNFQKENAFSNL